MITQKTLEFNSTRDYDAWYELNKGFVVIQSMQYANVTYDVYNLSSMASPIPVITVYFIEFPRDP